MKNEQHLRDEQEYLEQLKHERYMFCWCLMTYADMPVDVATAKAAAFYAYQPPGNPNRDIIFHDEAWHWAMLHIIGEQYWLSKPEYLTPSQQYIDLSNNIDLSNKEGK